MRKQFGVDDSAMLVVAHLGEHGSLTPTALSKLVALGSTGITAALQPLDAGGWNDRHAHQTDGRSQFVSLAPAGARRAQEFYRPLV